MNFFLTSHFDLLLEENTVESLRHNKEGLAIYCTKTAASCLREREERAMAMVQEEKKNVRKPEQLHHVILENRSKMSISGVEEVDSFDEEKIVLFTTMGLLEIRGAGLHISHLNVESGEIAVEGNIYTLDYSDEDSKRMTLLQKLFR